MRLHGKNAVALFLASGEASYVTAVSYYVAGGLMLQGG